ncbi:hypothetical protein [Acetobacter sp. DsW_063]|uniref:hypothetical protein n=1 Tax=Acetobacter sp. DsW_063 TaxID=1514894 RepID=UPI00130240AC|nr:hypothetical protein [Acetobacter sp. DsW_063]
MSVPASVMSFPSAVGAVEFLALAATSALAAWIVRIASVTPEPIRVRARRRR